MFKDITQASGIEYTGGSYGVAWGDYNQDGFIDFWGGNHGFAGSLYENQGDGTFDNVTLAVFGNQPQGDFHGASWADFDNDGDLDLTQLVGGDAGKSSLEDPELANQLYINEGGKFSNRASVLGLDYTGSRARTPLWFDRNNDGSLDLLQGAAKRVDGNVPATIFQQQPQGNFQSLNSRVEADFDGTRFTVLSDIVGDDTPELISYDAREGLSIYDSVRLENLTDEVLDQQYKAKDIISGDFNGDLLPDLYLTRRGLSNSAFNSPDPNSLNLNLFTEAEDKGITFSTNGKIAIDLWTFGFGFEEIDPENIFIGGEALNPEEFEVDFGAPNETLTELTLTLDPNDARVEGITDFAPEDAEGLYIGYDPATQEWKLQLSTADRDLVAGIIRSEHEIADIEAIGFNNDLEPPDDLLLISNGLELLERTEGTGLNSVRTAGVSTVAGDFDNDMDLDLYVLTSNAAGNEPNVLYDNQGDGTFEAISNLGDGEGSSLGVGDTVSTADYNNDGFLDLFLTNGEFPHLLNKNAPYQLLENQGNDNHWLTVDLEGTISNRDGIGAKVYVTAGGVTQIREQTGGMHDKVQNDMRLHFGLADNTVVEDIRVEWSSGVTQNLADISADQILDIVEPEVNLSFL
ncbi:MAG: CRTAC1 family protein [Cyanobacteria bacterium J06600_6]